MMFSSCLWLWAMAWLIYRLLAWGVLLCVSLPTYAHSFYLLCRVQRPRQMYTRLEGAKHQCNGTVTRTALWALLLLHTSSIKTETIGLFNISLLLQECLKSKAVLVRGGAAQRKVCVGMEVELLWAPWALWLINQMLTAQCFMTDIWEKLKCVPALFWSQVSLRILERSLRWEVGLL